MLEEIERSLAEPEGFGRFVIELDGEAAGMLGFHVANERSRIARLERLAIHPRFRGRRLADEAARLFQRHLLGELGYHRLELEIYAFNERACAHAERVGFVREGRKRKAYLKDGEWVDSLYLLPATNVQAMRRVAPGEAAGTVRRAGRPARPPTRASANASSPAAPQVTR